MLQFLVHRASFSTRGFHAVQILGSAYCSANSSHKQNANNLRFGAVHHCKPKMLSQFPSSVVSSNNLHTSAVLNGLFEDSKTKSLTVWTNLKEVKASPIPALTLGLAGLVPFVAAPSYMIISNVFMSNVAFAQLAYGASILSFLGGVRWGFTLYEGNPVQPDWVNLGYSVIPSLIAWTGLMLPTTLSVFTVMGGLTFAAYCDMAMYGYPAWFKGLRFLLSFVAILSLWTTFMCSFMLKKEKTEHSEEKL